MKLVLDLEKSVAPEGYQFADSEVRHPKEGEYYGNSHGYAGEANHDFTGGNYPILKKAEPWRADSGRVYYSVKWRGDRFIIWSYIEFNTELDKRRYKSGHYWKTRNEGDETLNKLNSVIDETLNE